MELVVALAVTAAGIGLGLGAGVAISTAHDECRSGGLSVVGTLAVDLVALVLAFGAYGLLLHVTGAA